MDDIQLKLFTVADLKAFFIRGEVVPLLSDAVINRTRAYATIMNPYVTDDMKIVSALFVNQEVAAYTYVFPDKLERPDRLLFWNTVLYVSPKYEGRGYGYIVIANMYEQYEDAYFDLDAAPASIENLKFAGLQVDFVNQYYLADKSIHGNSIRSKLAKSLESFQLYRTGAKQKLEHQFTNATYKLQYLKLIDDQTYQFIKEHSGNDIFLRSKEMLNWIITYSLNQESPISKRIQEKCAFSSTREKFRFYAVQVWNDNVLIGFYIIRNSNENIYLNYIYYDDSYKETVYLSVLEHIHIFGKLSFVTTNKGIADYINAFGYYSKYYCLPKSFSHPKSFIYDSSKNIQGGDGDNIT